MNTLIKNATIITSSKNMLINDGYIFIEGSIIKDVGLMKELSSDNLIIDEVIDATNHIVMPGLVNCHTHSPMTLLRNYGSDLNLQDWLNTMIFPKEALLTDNDIYYGSLLGIAEMISTGTTTFADMYYNMDNIARAVTESGIRSNISYGPFSNKYDDGKRITIKDFDSTQKFIDNWNGSADGRIKTSVEIHSTYLFEHDFFPDAFEFVKKNNLSIHIHLHETKQEIEESIVRYGLNPIQICDKYKLLDLPMFAAHCVHLSDDDIKLISDKEFSVVHNPTSNLKLASGIARVPDLLDAGVNVALGTDGASSNNNLNMFEEMHIAAILHKGVTGDPKVVDAETAIKMATLNGGRALGFNNIGSIEPGKNADIIMIDTDNVHHYPIADPVASIVYSTQGGDVDTVIVNGNILYNNKEFKTIDIERVKFEFNKCVERLFNE